MRSVRMASTRVRSGEISRPGHRSCRRPVSPANEVPRGKRAGTDRSFSVDVFGVLSPRAVSSSRTNCLVTGRVRPSLFGTLGIRN